MVSESESELDDGSLTNVARMVVPETVFNEADESLRSILLVAGEALESAAEDMVCVWSKLPNRA